MLCRAVIAALQTGDYAALLAKDQLRQVQATKSAFQVSQLCRGVCLQPLRRLLMVRLEQSQGFEEGEIRFAPTFKLYPNSAAYNPARTPSYTDRILWRQTPHQSRVCCKPITYESLVAIDVSDHRPVTATFSLCVSPATNRHLDTKSLE